MMKDNISILGAGNLGLSLVKGLVESGEFTPQQFKLSRRRIEKLNEMGHNGFSSAFIKGIMISANKAKYLYE